MADSRFATNDSNSLSLMEPSPFVSIELKRSLDDDEDEEDEELDCRMSCDK